MMLYACHVCVHTCVLVIKYFKKFSSSFLKKKSTIENVFYQKIRKYCMHVHILYYYDHTLLLYTVEGTWYYTHNSYMT